MDPANTSAPITPQSSNIDVPVVPQKSNSTLMILLVGIIIILAVTLYFSLTGRFDKTPQEGVGSPTPLTTTVAPTSTPEITTGLDDTTIPTEAVTPTVSGALTGTATVTPTPQDISLSIHMFDNAKFNQAGNSDYTTAVIRKTDRKDIATFSLEQIIIGPTQLEITSKNMKPTFGVGTFVNFTSNSNCNGKDFSISINAGDTTVRFCRTTQLSGDSSGTIIVQQFTKTLKQFSSIKRVRVLNNAGNCFDDLSGLGSEVCWK